MTPTLRLLRAEWRKAVGNSWVMGCAFVIWPLFALVMVCGLLLLGLLAEFGLTRADLREVLSMRWDVIALDLWYFGANVLVQLAVLSFAAIVFGGEYNWRTWKNIAPRRPRYQLILAKYAVLVLLVAAALTLTSFLMTLGFGVVSLMFGSGYGTLDGAVLGEFVVKGVIQVAMTTVGTLFVASMVAIAAILSRSMLVGALGGIVGLALDQLLIPAAMAALAILTKSDVWREVLRLGFMYNLSSAGSALRDGSSAAASSLLILALWLAVLLGLSLRLFQKQDL